MLVLGAPLDTITLLHHAEHVAAIAGKRVKRYRRKLALDTGTQWADIEKFDPADPVVDGMPADAYAFEAAGLHRIGVDWLENWRPG